MRRSRSCDPSWPPNGKNFDLLAQTMRNRFAKPLPTSVFVSVLATTSSDTRELSGNSKTAASSVFRPRLDRALGDAQILGSALVRFAHPNPF